MPAIKWFTALTTIVLCVAGCQAGSSADLDFGNPSVSSLNTFAEVRRDPQRDTVISAKSNALGQELEGEEVYRRLVSQAAYEELAAYFLYAYRVDLRLSDPREELVSSGINVDSIGYRQIRFNQLYKKLPVIDSQLIVQFDQAGRMNLLQGRYAPTPALGSLIPSMSEDQVTQIATLRYGAATKIDSLRIVVFPDERGRAFLAYELLVNQGQPGGLRIILDANTGNELRKTPTSYSGR